jgi:hypothetical protein
MTNIPEEQTFFGHQSTFYSVFLQKCRDDFPLWNESFIDFFILQNTIYFLMILELLIAEATPH